MEQDEDRCGDPCEGKGWIDGGEDKGGKNQEDEERGGVMCPICGREEEVLSPIRRQAEERDEFFFSVICMFERGGWPRGRCDYI